MTADTTDDLSGHVAELAGQLVAELPPPVAMTGVVQPPGWHGVELRCLACGEMFVARRRDRRTCSPRCARRAAAARRKILEAIDGRVCEECGCVFVGGRSDRRYCRPRCRMRAYRRRQRELSERATDGVTR